MESIIQLYEQGELHQHYQRLASPKISGDEFKRCFLRENPFSIYFLAQLIEEVTGESTAAYTVYKLLAKARRKEVINPASYSKEKFFDLFKFIRSATKEQLQRYGHPAGLYFLATDMEPHGGAHPKQLYLCVGKKKWLQYLLAHLPLELSWQPKFINLSVAEIEKVCNFLKENYLQDREQFFKVYGSKAGCVLLAQKFKINPQRLSMLIPRPEFLTAIMDISNEEEFEKRFNPYPVRLTLKEMEVVLEFLQNAYKADPEAFFQRYGSRLGYVYLARDLVADGLCEYINLDGLSSMLRDSEMVLKLLLSFPDFLQIDKKTISSQFSPLYIRLPLAILEALIKFLKERYNEDASSFFARYGAEKGVLALAKDLELEYEKKINRIPQLSKVVSDGKELAKLLQIEDSRFLEWNPSYKDSSKKKRDIDKERKKIKERWERWNLQCYKEIEAHGLLPLMEDSIDAYNEGLIDAHSLVRRLYYSNCLEKIEKIGININSMATLVSALIAGSVFKKENTGELNRATGGFEIYLAFQASGLMDEFEVEFQSYNEGKISAYVLARRLYQSGILDKAKEIGRNVDSMGTIAQDLIAGGLLPEKKKAELTWAFSYLDFFLKMKESGHLLFLQSEIESYKKGKISVQTFAYKLLSSGILSSLQDCGQPVDSINSVVLALIAGGVIEEKNKVELSRYTSHLDLYRWLEKNGFLNELRGLIEAYKAGKIKEHAFVSKLHQSSILSKIEETKKDVDSIATLAWAIAVGEEIPQSKFVSLGWEASAVDLYRDMEKNGFIEELRPLAEAYNCGEFSKYAFVRQLHQTSILSKVQGSGRDVLSYETLISALTSGGLLPYDSKTGLKWVSGAFDVFRDIAEDKNISAYLQDYCDVLNARIEDKEISPALYALHISLLHNSVNQILKRKGRNIHASMFFYALVSGGIIPESLDNTINSAINALRKAEALALKKLYKSSSSFSDFYLKMVDNWHSLREDLRSTYTKGAPPEKPFSRSYAKNIWRAFSAMEATL